MKHYGMKYYWTDKQDTGTYQIEFYLTSQKPESGQMTTITSIHPILELFFFFMYVCHFKVNILYMHWMCSVWINKVSEYLLFSLPWCILAYEIECQRLYICKQPLFFFLQHPAHFINWVLSFCQIQYWSLFVHRGSYINVRWALVQKWNVNIVPFCLLSIL